MTVTVLLFAMLKEVAGTPQLQLELPSGATLSELKVALAKEHPALEQWFSHVRFALNQEYAHDTTKINNGDEVALIPPVSGGAEPFVDVREGELSLDEVVRAVQNEIGGAAGAICTFLGVVRSNSVAPDGQRHDDIEFLDYEAYGPMAKREMLKIALEIRERFGAACAITHRTGRLGIGEASVAIAVATPHRAESFEACRYAIETLKQQVPIWKKETARDGFWWVEQSGSFNG